MNILVLNGSPRKGGNTSAMVDAFAKGAKEAGHEVKVFDVCHMDIKGCMACEYCHSGGNGQCAEKDDMQEIYPYFAQAEMFVMASPVYYLHISGQLQCALNRTYSIGIPAHLKKSMLILSSGASDVYEGAIYSYRRSVVEYMGTEDVGVVTAYGAQNKSSAKLDELYRIGRAL